MIETNRLRLRAWHEKDTLPFAKLNADPQVMRYFPNTLSRKQSDAIIAACQRRLTADGFCFMAVELKDSHEFIGMVGLNTPRIKLPFSPCVEVGWRLAQPYWHKGYATEAAMASLNYGFNQLNLSQIVSFTTVNNTPSIRVMQRIGMTNTQQNFLHPSVAPNHALAEHVLYTITKQQFFDATPNACDFVACATSRYVSKPCN